MEYSEHKINIQFEDSNLREIKKIIQNAIKSVPEGKINVPIYEDLAFGQFGTTIIIHGTAESAMLIADKILTLGKDREEITEYFCQVSKVWDQLTITKPLDLHQQESLLKGIKETFPIGSNARVEQCDEFFKVIVPKNTKASAQIIERCLDVVKNISPSSPTELEVSDTYILDTSSATYEKPNRRHESPTTYKL